jgi:hypothetical protein
MARELSRTLSKEGKKYVASQKVHSYGYIARCPANGQHD